VEIASREFVDNLVSILKTPSLNRDVKNKILRYIQTWAISFKGKYNLGYVEQVYQTLKTEGEFYTELWKYGLAITLSRIHFPTRGSRHRGLGPCRHANRSGVDRL
jgi:VHS domain